MNGMHGRRMLAAIGAGTLMLAGGCSFDKHSQLEAMARDWCYTIRASQVIPVYPLTEDLQPGDVFLVQVPVERQQELYKAKGFLPLDYHIARLQPFAYGDFYSHSFIDAPGSGPEPMEPRLPRDWMRPAEGDAWTPAPNAAFPTYSFSVQRGAGLNLAVPVHGVPVGLSLLGSDSATGTIVIDQSHTFGVDTISLYRQLQEWAAANRGFLAAFEPVGDGQGRNYLRVVSRIYNTGKVDILLNDASSFSAGADVGAPKPVDLLRSEPGSSDSFGNYRDNLEKLNAMLASPGGSGSTLPTPAGVIGGALPGGSLRVNAAGGRTISMSQTFAEPLVIGYLGFDVAIGRAGVLGAPIPTHAVLARTPLVATDRAPTPERRVLAVAFAESAYRAIESDPRPEAVEAREALDGLGSFVPSQYTAYELRGTTNITIVERQGRANPGAPAGFLDYLQYRSALDRSIAALDQALARDRFVLAQVPGGAVEVDRGSDEAIRLQSVRDGFDRIRRDPVREDAWNDALSQLERAVFGAG